jgi:phage-related protein
VTKNVVYYIDERGGNPVWDFLNSLPPDEREKCFEYIAYLEQAGEQVRRPVGDYVGDKLYELRPKQTRILYFFMLKDYAVLVHAFRKKTDEIPEREMRLAKTRMNDFILRHQKGQIRLGGKRK